MISVDYEVAVLLSEQLSIVRQDTGTVDQFIINDEQKKLLKNYCKYNRNIVAKSRQVGSSTVACFFLLCSALVNPGLRFCIITDKQDKSEALLDKIKNWLLELGVKPIKANTRVIVIPNGTQIDALTAVSTGTAESKVGRSASYAGVLASELAFFSDDESLWASLTSTLLKDAWVIVESSGAPGETVFKNIWYNNSEYRKRFFSVEDHPHYVMPPESIDDDKWEELRQKYSFTSRAHAAWWHNKLIKDFNNDTVRMCREYSVIVDHVFIFAEGRHITKYTECEVVVDGNWNYYNEPKEDLIIGVDTAFGQGRDASALAIIGHKTGRLHATYRDNKIEIHEWINFLRSVITKWSPIIIVIETNGYGGKVYDNLQGFSITKHISGAHDGELHHRRSKLKGDIELAEFPIGGHTILEVQGSIAVEKGRLVKFEGPDDVLSAISFARQWRENNPYIMPADHKDKMNKFFMELAFAQEESLY